MKKAKCGSVFLGIGLLAVFFFLSACGIKGPPLPPIEEETIQKQKASEQQLQKQSTEDEEPTVPIKKKRK